MMYGAMTFHKLDGGARAHLPPVEPAISGCPEGASQHPFLSHGDRLARDRIGVVLTISMQLLDANESDRGVEGNRPICIML